MLVVQFSVKWENDNSILTKFKLVYSDNDKSFRIYKYNSDLYIQIKK